MNLYYFTLSLREKCQNTVFFFLYFPVIGLNTDLDIFRAVYIALTETDLQI